MVRAARHSITGKKPGRTRSLGSPVSEKEWVERQLAEVQASMARRIHDIEHEITPGSRAIRTTVAKRPVLFLAAALAAGLMVGRQVSRRRRAREGTVPIGSPQPRPSGGLARLREMALQALFDRVIHAVMDHCLERLHPSGFSGSPVQPLERNPGGSGDGEGVPEPTEPTGGGVARSRTDIPS